MATIGTTSFDVVMKLLNFVETMDGFGSLEQAAQEFTGTLYRRFKDSLALIRLFATVPFGELPRAETEFVKRLAAGKKITPLIRQETPVLTLIGTSGDKPSWNDRRNSKGHVGIPLASSEFISAIPMMSRLLEELGMDLGWFGQQESRSEIAWARMANVSGLFYVEDAATVTDSSGRMIISDQTFVGENRVKTVFGMGGAYPLTTTMLVAILFTREKIPKSRAEWFAMLLNGFKMATLDFSSPARIFTGPGVKRVAGTA
ncbi:MAG: hypothetical protein AB1646_20360 [Thermodesulfobacteriota bacterium]